jgi:hypothetical protein
MAKALFLTFVALSASGLALADYTNQTIRVGAKFGDLGMREYADTYTARYNGMRDGWAADALAADLRSKEPRELLPLAPEGWTMREWNETDRAQLFPPTDAPEVPPELQATLDESLIFSGLQAAGEHQARAKELAQTRFYQKGDSLIALQLSYRSPQGDGGGIQGLSMNIIEGNMAAMSGHEGFAVIKGVAYGRSTGLFGAEGAGDGGPRVLTGRMGDEIRITVRALASDEDISTLLSSIDYDRLSTMMVRPVGGVGADAVDIPLDQQRGAADAVIAGQTQELMDRARESEAAIIAMGEVLRPDSDADAGSGGLGGLFGMNAVAATEDTDAAPPPAQVRRIGDNADCIKVGARKSCGVQTD